MPFYQFCRPAIFAIEIKLAPKGKHDNHLRPLSETTLSLLPLEARCFQSLKSFFRSLLPSESFTIEITIARASGLQYFSENFRRNLTYYIIKNFSVSFLHHIFGSVI